MRGGSVGVRCFKKKLRQKDFNGKKKKKLKSGWGRAKKKEKRVKKKYWKWVYNSLTIWWWDDGK